MIRTSLLSLPLLLIAASASGQDAATPAPAAFLQDRYGDTINGELAPKITLHSNDGDKLALESLQGHPVVIFYWATWCGNCMVGIRSLAGLARDLPKDTIVLGVDFDRDPAAATTALAREHIAIRNFHDDANFREPEGLHVKFHLHSQPFPMSILINADGQVVYCERSIFREEFRDVVRNLEPQPTLLLPHVGQAQAGRQGTSQTTMPVADLRALASQAIASQSEYLESQKKYRCRYQVTTRDEYGGGRSQHNIQQIDEVFAGDGRRLISNLVQSGTSSQPDLTATAASQTFTIWSNPVLAAIMEHSILSNIARTRVGRAEPYRYYAQFTVRGDPTYVPVSDVERMAQSIEGGITIDITDKVFAAIDAVAAYDVIEGNRFLLQRDMPVFSFHASAFEEALLPYEWSLAAFQPVPAGPNQHREWLATLTRTFGLRESCEQFHVTSEILPGFKVVEPEK